MVRTGMLLASLLTAPLSQAQTPDSFNPNANSTVYSAVVQADGKVLLGGTFTFVGGVTRNCVARLNADGSVDSGFNPSTNGFIYCMAVQTDGKVLLGGDFTSVGGVMRIGVARLNADGSLDSSFDPNANGTVYSMALQADGKVLLGGNFTTVGAVTRNRVARLNADGSLDSGFDPNANSRVLSLALQADGKALLAGGFTTVGGVTRIGVARANADGSLDNGFDPHANSAVNSVLVQADGKVLLAGEFTTVGGVTRNRMARVNADGSLDNSFSPNASSTVYSMALQADGRLLLGGSFTSVGGVTRNRVARLNADGSLDSGFDPNANGTVYSMAAQPDGKVLLGGAFTSVGGMTRLDVARLLNDTTPTQTLTVTGTEQIDWVRGGSAPEVGRVSFENWNGSAWVAVGSSPGRVAGGWRVTGLSLPAGGWVRARGWASGGQCNGSASLIEQVITYGSANLPDIAVEQSSGTALVDGAAAVDFGSVDWLTTGAAKTFTIRNAGTADLTGLAISVGGVDASDFILGSLGSSSLAPGASTTFTVAFRPLGGGQRNAQLQVVSNDADETPFDIALTGKGLHQDSSFNPSTNGFIYSMAVQTDGKVLLGGAFTMVGGVTRSYVARLNADGSLDGSFDPNASSTVHSMALQAGGRVLLGGSFTAVGGVTRNRVARLNADGSLDSGFNPNANGVVYSLALQADGKALLAGTFTTIGGVTRNRVARLNADGSLDNSFNSNADSWVYGLALQADGKVLLGGDFTSVGGVTRNFVARVNADGSLDGSFNPNANGTVNSVLVQADGKVLLGGGFTSVGGVTRNRVARLNADGSLDGNFNPNATNTVYSVALQPDGKVLLGGGFGTVGGVLHNYVARLPNDTIATQMLTVTGTEQIDWVRGGSAPEVERVNFESWNGSAWVAVAGPAWTAGSWQTTGLSLPVVGWVRARGWASSGQCNGSSSQIEQVLAYGTADLPDIVVEQPLGTELVSGVAAVDFGSVTWLETGTAKTFTIRNAGTADLTGLAVSLEGEDKGEFILGSLGSTSLAPGASTSFSVAFRPLGGGQRTAQLQVASNDLDETPFRIAVTGTGVHLDSSFNPRPNGIIYCMAKQVDGKVLLGGSFTTIGGVTRNRVARLNADGSLDSVFNPNANGPVYSMALQADGRVLLGGNFTTVGGVTRSSVARLNAGGSLDSNYNPNANWTIYSLALQADGKVLLGGDFTSVGGVTRNHVARLKVDGSLDSGFDPNANSTVNSIALQADGKVLLGGWFTTVGGVTRNRVARLNADGSLDSGFNPSANDWVNSMVVQADGKVLLGGVFTAVGGVTRNFVARLNADGSLDSSFDPNASSTVHSMALQADGRVLLGGSFTAVGGVTCNRVARLNADGSVDSGFNPNATNTVYCVALQPDGKVLLGGWFTSVSGVLHNYVARLPNDTIATQTLTVTGTAQIDWARGGSAPEVGQVSFENWNGSAWVAVSGLPAWTAGSWRVTGLSLPAGGWVRARGWASGGQYNGSSSPIEQVITYGTANLPDIAVEQPLGTELLSGVAAVDFGSEDWLETGSAKTFTIRNTGSANLTGLARGLVGEDYGEFILGSLGSTSLAPGASTTVTVAFRPLGGGQRTAQLQVVSNDLDETPFRIDVTGTGLHQDSNFNPNANGTVYCAATQADGKVLLGGTFTTIGGVTRNRLARMNADGSLDRSFDPNASDLVYSVAVQADGKVLLGGFFTAVGGVTRNRVARLNADGSLDGSFNPSASGTVNSLTVQADGKVLLGGSFTTVGGVTRNRVVRLNADGSVDSSFNPNASSTVYSMGLQVDGKVLLGGNFTSVGGVARNFVARVNADGTLDNSFNPNASGTVTCVAVQADGKILLGGFFGTVGGATRRFVARLNADGSSDSSFDPNANNAVYGLALQADGKVLLGGIFTAMGGVVRNRVARLHANGSLDSSFNPNASSTVYSLALQPDGQVLLGGVFDTVGGVTRNDVARLPNDTVATQTLTVTGAAQIDWLRGGSAPEVQQVGFELWNGSGWLAVGSSPARVAGGWQATGLSLPVGGWVRARGWAIGGQYNGSASLVEQVAAYGTGSFPDVAVEQPEGTGLVDGTAATSFGSTGVLHAGAILTYIVRNLGSGDLSGLGLSIDGPHSADFAASELAVSSLSPGGSATFTVSFTPSGSGLRSATLHLASSDADETPFDIDLTGVGLETDANLSGLTLSSGTLSPGFDGGTTEYAATVSLATVSLTPTVAQADATLQVRVNGGGYASVLSGNASELLGLNVGANQVEVLVTAQDGMTVKTYTVVVTRQSAAPAVATPSWAAVTASSATLGGTVTDDGGATIAGRGVVYAPTATSGDPDLGEAGVIAVSTSGTTGAFSIPVAGLVPGTAYSFKAYATNSVGTGYSAAGNFATLTAAQAAVAWMEGHGLTGADTQPLATPFQDGVENLLKYAFNLNASGPDSHEMPVGGNAGLPAIDAQGQGAGRTFRFEYLRRFGSGLTYTPQISGTLEANDWEDVVAPMVFTETVTTIDAQWQRVVVTVPVAGENVEFGRVEVAAP